MRSTALALIALLALATGQARADVVHLRSGGLVEGRIVEEDTATVVVEKASGMKMTINRPDIVRIEKKESSLDQYEAQAADAETKKTVESFLALADWCKQNRMRTQEVAALERALEIDADNIAALQRLGRAPEPYKVAHNAIQNASLELDPRNYGTLWRLEDSESDLVTKVSADQAHSGKSSLSLTASKAGAKWPGWATVDKFPVVVGGTYELHAWLYTTDGAAAWLEAMLLDEQGKPLVGQASGCVEIPQASTWTEKRVTFTPQDPNTRFVRLALRQCLDYSRGKKTTVYVDDLYFGPPTKSAGN
ncbi:MAG: hypothetical protein HYV63_16740 [Candidatus Schekmanbacteria bacterium]|nr:hypothetical protein [Candidatus Schekmanbacteria bacterium]